MWIKVDFENIKGSIERKEIYAFGTGGIYEKYKDVIKNYRFQGF